MCITIIRGIKILFLSFLLFSSQANGQSIKEAQIAQQYYEKGDIEKAKDTYERLAKNKVNIPFIHRSYFNILLREEEPNLAIYYIKNVKKWYPENINYTIDEGIIYWEFENKKKAEDIFSTVIKQVKSNPTLVRTTAQYFFQQNFPQYAIQMFLEGRDVSGNPSDFSLELANLYRRVNNKESMVEEYLNFVQQSSANLGYVQNLLQSVLTEEDDLRSLENILYSKIQKFPDSGVYNELLIWTNIQLKNFYGAFVQARALDRKGKEGGNRLLEVGAIAMNNKDYDRAEKIFNYVIQTYKSGINYEVARRYLINSREHLVKNSYPIDKEAILVLVDDYDQLIQDLGINGVTLEAMRSKALLHAFYLDERDTAIQLLEKVIKTPRVAPQLSAKAKLDLGDIYLLNNEPWESALLYAQVEKSEKETVLGYEAKFKSAKLSYYKGDFVLAQAHLDVLKLATSREIANDAMALSLLIQNNIAFDTTEKAMREYAFVDLLIFQNKEDEALSKLDEMLKAYPRHSLTDEIWWLKANILTKRGNFDEAIILLDKIVNQYPYDVLSDDAYFLIGTIYEDHLQQKEKAMDIYQSFLVEYPGSLYAAEARNRFRKLRGDFLKDDPFLNN